MKNFIIAAALFVLMCLAPTAKSQTRVLVGASGGESFGNGSIGVMGAVEVPITKHFEFDLKDVFSPVESHVALGHGTANIVGGGGIVWATKNMGFAGSAEYSTYNVTQVSKGGLYVYGGPVWRVRVLDFPGRFEVDYLRELHNGITNGVETSHMQGVAVSLDLRLGCAGAVCFRMKEQFAIGRVLTQGNPVCDGTDGPIAAVLSCPRRGATGGSMMVTFGVEFPRRKATENDTF